MKHIHAWVKMVTFLTISILFGTTVQAATLDWDVVGWPATTPATTSQNYIDVDGSGINISVTMTGDTNRFTSNTPYDVTDAIVYYPDYADNVEQITTTITFSSPVMLTGLNWRDIDSGTFNDHIIISAIDTNGATVLPNNVVLGNAIVENAVGDYESDGTSLSDTNARGWVTLDFNQVAITKLTFVYTNGSLANSNPDAQLMYFDNIVFDPLDTDGDGVPNHIDIDDDNDGILDTLERSPVLDQSVANTSSGIIPDNGSPNNCLDRIFTIPDSSVVTDVKIKVDIEHTWRNDLIIQLISPWGNSVDLIRNEGDSDNNLSAEFFDAATTSIVGDNTNFILGSFLPRKPEELLSIFNGEDPQGDWTLHMCDDAGADEGTFNEANLTINYLHNLDSDGDGILDYLDLDSDNDGIPDNVEAQSTVGYTAPTGIDTDGDGLDDAYDPDNGGTAVPLPDLDGDGIRDNLDSDSDNDGYTDCEEGLDPTQNCPLTGEVGINGLTDFLEQGGTDQGYTSTNNGITNPNPDNGGTDLQNEVAGNDEAAYREFLCGKALIHLTAYNWRLISLPCDTGSNTVSEVFGSQLGTYDIDFVMYKQTGTSDHYEVNATHTNTDKTKLAGADLLEQEISYWIITAADHDVTIPKTQAMIDKGLAPTTTQDASSVNITNPNFSKIAQGQLPNNIMSQSGNIKKYMAGNPFPYTFDLSNLYFKHQTAASDIFNPMGDNANDSFISAIVYKHDSPDTGPSVGYEAVTASTPGFNAPIQPMEGFFIKLLEENTDNGVNTFSYPLTYGNDN